MIARHDHGLCIFFVKCHAGTSHPHPRVLRDYTWDCCASFQDPWAFIDKGFCFFLVDDCTDTNYNKQLIVTLELFGDNESIVILGNYDLNNALGTLTDNLSSSIASSNKIIVKNANFQSHGWLLIIKPLFYQYLYPESTYPLGIIFHLYLHQLFYL